MTASNGLVIIRFAAVAKDPISSRMGLAKETVSGALAAMEPSAASPDRFPVEKALI
jgi:hypothetical protein